MNTRSFLLSALIAGAVIGIFGNLPLLNLVNCFLCVFAWIGGALAVYLYRRFQHGGPDLTTGQGAGLGAVSGLIGAVIGVVVYLVTSSLSTPILTSLYRTIDPTGQLPMETGTSGTLITALVFFFLDAVLYTAFGALAAFITTSVLTKQKQNQTTAI